MDILKKHLLTILCIISIITLALPLASVEATIETEFISQSNSRTVTGFQALQSSFFTYLLLLGPVLLIAMNYIKQLHPYKGILAIVVPLVCLISLIIVIMQVKSASAKADNGYASAEIKFSMGIGAFLAGISYVATMIAGAVEFHNFTLNKAGLEKLKSSATGMINNAQARFHAPQGAQQPVSYDPNTGAPVMAAPKPAAPQPKKSANLSRIDEVLALIERLSAMKESGILTEEEFSSKKKQLLEEIQ